MGIDGSSLFDGAFVRGQSRLVPIVDPLLERQPQFTELDHGSTERLGILGTDCEFLLRVDGL